MCLTPLAVNDGLQRENARKTLGGWRRIVQGAALLVVREIKVEIMVLYTHFKLKTLQYTPVIERFSI